MDNFVSIFEELSKLYEEEVPAAEKKEPIKEACADKLEEATDDEVIDVEEPAEDADFVEEPAEDEPKQVVIECDGCGALVIRTEADLAVDEESDLVNVEEECKFCEESKGYKIVGTVIPYEVEDDVIEIEDDEIPEMLDEIDEDEVVTEDLGDVARKVFDKPASIETQQYWEQRLTDLNLELEGEDLTPSERAKIESEISKIEKKFAQQRDWEARHPKKDDTELEELLDFSVPVNISANDNEVAVGGLTS